MKLYHFTSIYHLPLIQKDGFLKVVESNIKLEIPHFGPDVVWLTDLEKVDNERNCGLISNVNKKGVRFTVDVEAERWRDFANRYGISRAWYRALDATGGFTAKHWWVYPHPIPSNKWLAVDILE